MKPKEPIDLTGHRVVAREQWIKERTVFLKREKEFTRERDELSRQRRELPWVKVDKSYSFDGPNGKETLSDLFAGKSQLVVYHFMFNPTWADGCKACSFWADNFNGIPVHLRARDITIVAISRAPLEKLEAFKKRMGWSFKWLSSGNSDFNYDFHVSFTPEDVANGTMNYNYATGKFGGQDREGISVFYKDPTGGIYHTYSCYARGLDLMNTAYNYMDLAPKGRNEYGPWLQLRDKYQD